MQAMQHRVPGARYDTSTWYRTSHSLTPTCSPQFKIDIRAASRSVDHSTRSSLRPRSDYNAVKPSRMRCRSCPCVQTCTGIRRPAFQHTYRCTSRATLATVTMQKVVCSPTPIHTVQAGDRPAVRSPALSHGANHTGRAEGRIAVRSPALSYGASGGEASSALPHPLTWGERGEASSAQPRPLEWGEREGAEQCTPRPLTWGDRGEDSSAQPRPLTWGERRGGQQCAAPPLTWGERGRVRSAVRRPAFSHGASGGEASSAQPYPLTVQAEYRSLFIEQCRAQWSKPFLPNFSN